MKKRKPNGAVGRACLGSPRGWNFQCPADLEISDTATSVRLLLKQRQLVRRPVSFILRTKCLKELFYGRFLEHADAQDLENFVERSVDIETFFEQRHQRIDAYRHPQLGAHRIGA